MSLSVNSTNSTNPFAFLQSMMQQASVIVLEGFTLRTEAQIVKYPERCRDPRGEVMWRTVMELCGR